MCRDRLFLRLRTRKHCNSLSRMWRFTLLARRQTKGGVSFTISRSLNNCFSFSLSLSLYTDTTRSLSTNNCFSCIFFIMLCMQLCWYFPLAQQLQSLLKIGNYRELLMYEREHRHARRDDDFMCDLYDSPRWQTLAGPLCSDVRNRSLARIVLHMCVDGVEAFAHGRQKGGSTVKPIQYWIANLAP